MGKNAAKETVKRRVESQKQGAKREALLLGRLGDRCKWCGQRWGDTETAKQREGHLQQTCARRPS